MMEKARNVPAEGPENWTSYIGQLSLRLMADSFLTEPPASSWQLSTIPSCGHLSEDVRDFTESSTEQNTYVRFLDDARENREDLRDGVAIREVGILGEDPRSQMNQDIRETFGFGYAQPAWSFSFA